MLIGVRKYLKMYFVKEINAHARAHTHTALKSKTPTMQLLLLCSNIYLTLSEGHTA